MKTFKAYYFKTCYEKVSDLKKHEIVPGRITNIGKSNTYITMDEKMSKELLRIPFNESILIDIEGKEQVKVKVQKISRPPNQRIPSFMLFDKVPTDPFWLSSGIAQKQKGFDNLQDCSV